MTEIDPKGIIQIYRQSVKNIPILRYSWVLISTICILALAAYFKLQNKDVFLYAIVIIIVSFIAFVFSFLTKINDKFIRSLIYVLVTSIIVVCSAAVLGFGSFIFFKTPQFYTRWFPDLTSSQLLINDTNKLSESSTQIDKEKKAKVKPTSFNTLFKVTYLKSKEFVLDDLTIGETNDYELIGYYNYFSGPNPSPYPFGLSLEIFSENGTFGYFEVKKESVKVVKVVCPFFIDEFFANKKETNFQFRLKYVNQTEPDFNVAFTDYLVFENGFKVVKK